MLPQTNAELTAYNFGVALAKSAGPYPSSQAMHIALAENPMTPARQQARDVLGPELFGSWAQRGFDATQDAASLSQP